MKTLMTALLLSLASMAFAEQQDEGYNLRQQVRQAYASLKFYTDKGLTTSTYGDLTTKIPFATYFAAPSRVRFDFTLSHPYWMLRWQKTKYSVWTDGTQEFMAHDGNVESTDDIGLYFGGGAVGLSLDTSPHIPSFLLQKAMGSGVYRGKQWRVDGVATIRGIPCIHARVEQWKGGYIDVWIAAKDHLIRRICEDDTLIDITSLSTTNVVDESLFKGK